MGETFPVQPPRGCFSLCVSAVKPHPLQIPVPDPQGGLPAPAFGVLGELVAVLACPARSVLGCGSLVAPAQQFQH